MATEEGSTLVSISDYNTDIVFEGGVTDDTINITLNKGESYVISGYTDTPANLTGFIGALVESNKNIVVNTGNFLGSFLSTGNNQDIAIDQIIPIENVATEYIAIKGNGTSSLEKLILIATENNTDIFINGTATPYNDNPLNAGDYLIIESDQYHGTTHQNMYINATTPIYVYQSLGGSTNNATTGFNFIPPLQCFLLKEISEISDIGRIGETDYTGNIVVATTVGAELSVNNIPVTTTPEAVLGNNEWETYRIDDLSGNVSVRSSGALSIAVYGANDNAGYAGYYSSFGLSPENTSITLCTNDEPINLLEYIDGFPDTGGNWSPDLSNETESIFDPTNDAAGTYNYYLNNSCRIIDLNVTITINPIPEHAKDLSYNECDDNNGSTTDGIADFNLEDHKETILNGQIDLEVSFYASTENAHNLIDPLPKIYTSDAVTIYVRLENKTTGCYTIAPLNLIIDAVPKISPTLNYYLCDNEDGDAFNGFANFDLDSQIQKIIDEQVNVEVTFHSSEDEANTYTNILASNYYSQSTTIYALVKNVITGCSSVGALQLNVDPTPETSLLDTYYLCKSDATNSISLDASPLTEGSYLYFWTPSNPNINSNGEESAIFNATTEGIYSVDILNQDTENFCEATLSTEVIESIPPVIIEIKGASETFIMKNSTTIEVITSGSGNYEYNLNDGSWQDSPIFNTIKGGSYLVTVRDKSSCEFEDRKSFELITFSPFFTPNGDKINDYWNIEGLSEMNDASIFIHDRFGKLLKQIIPNKELGWDGKFAGRAMPSSDYWAMIEYTKDGVKKKFTSHFTLIR